MPAYVAGVSDLTKETCKRNVEAFKYVIIDEGEVIEQNLNQVFYEMIRQLHSIM